MKSLKIQGLRAGPLADPTERSSHPWHAQEAGEVIQELNTDLESGLLAVEATRRLSSCGPNELDVHTTSTWHSVLARQFQGALILILFAAAALSVLIGEYVDALVILTIVLINGALGFVQEWKAEQAIETLQRMLMPHARVRRDGHDLEIDARALVPGDILALEVGARVPADVRLLEVVNLTIDESVLTGESLPVAKSSTSVSINTPLSGRTSMAWMGTTVTNGLARGVVIATAMQTEFGQIAGLTGAVEQEQTPLQRKLAVLGKQLGFIAIGVSILVIIAGVLSGKPMLEMLMTGISLSVAAVPEGLPAVVTITLALGIRAMVQRNVLVRRLPAAETLGAATVICTDKTGTLTQNEMTVEKIWLASGAVDLTGIGYDPAGHFEKGGQKIDFHTAYDLLQLLDTGLKCNHSEVFRDESGWHATGDPTEAALVVAAYKARLAPASFRDVLEFSFTSARKRMTVVHSTDEGMIALIKGAPEVILPRCTNILIGRSALPINDDWRQKAEAIYRDMAQSGRRTLALARRSIEVGESLQAENIENKLTLLGIVSIVDPPRPEVAGAVQLAKSAGIRIIMITGDAPETALAIGRNVRIDAQRVITGADLERLSDEELAASFDEEILFARTSPEHKLRIITSLKNRGEIVGMTGDGVNDAPALKKADIGIAMGKRGSDVAQSASDILLTDDNFASIIGGVEEGRRQYDNIQKFVRYLLASNTGEVLAIFTNILLGAPLLLLPIQILWMNLVTDGVTAVALSLEPVERGTMMRPPHKPKSHILNRGSFLLISVLGVYLAAGTLFLFHYYYNRGGENALMLATTAAFTGLVIMEKVNVFNFRSLHAPIHTLGLLTNPWLLLAVTLTIGLQVGAVYLPFLQVALKTVPLDLDVWLMIGMVAAPVFVVPELAKSIRWYLFKTRSG